MTTLHLWFRDGTSDEWPIHDSQPARKVSGLVLEGLSQRGILSIGLKATDGPSSEYSRLYVRMADVVAARVDGLYEETVDAALWAEMDAVTRSMDKPQPPGDDGDDPSVVEPD